MTKNQVGRFFQGAIWDQVGLQASYDLGEYESNTTTYHSPSAIACPFRALSGIWTLLL